MNAFAVIRVSALVLLSFGYGNMSLLQSWRARTEVSLLNTRIVSEQVTGSESA